jgi:hypothetical protein
MPLQMTAKPFKSVSQCTTGLPLAVGAASLAVACMVSLIRDMLPSKRNKVFAGTPTATGKPSVMASKYKNNEQYEGLFVTLC